MTRRHARAIAVFAIVLITLTGARRSHGGGCGGSDHDSGSSTTTTSGGFTSGGSTYDTSTPTPYDTGTPSTPSTYNSDAKSEVQVTTCEYNETTHEITADLSIVNSSSTDSFDYSITVEFEKTVNGVPTGERLGSDFVTAEVSAGQTGTETANTYYTFTEQTRFQCAVETATKFRSSY